MPRDYDESTLPAVHNLKDAPAHREEEGYRQVIFRGIDQMVGLSEIGDGKTDSEPHTHPFEQMNMLVDGRLDFLVDGERVELKPFDTLMIPPEVPHTSRKVAGETATLLAIWPLREDRLAATEYQTEFPEP
jgi:quercetin dioxygenase-like cupin family protein